tara:strand:- start:385 stop:711 length:327 start_codon:yes stop_codon:yes gene_type:complete
MVLLSMGAQLVETVIVRGAIYVVELGGQAMWWVGSTAFEYVWPRTREPTPEERMAESIRELQAKVDRLEERESRLELDYFSKGSAQEDALSSEDTPPSWKEPLPGEER